MSNAFSSPMSASTLRIILTVAATIVLSCIVYYLTAFRTITWWNSGELSLVAGTLGVAAPPGCLLGTILGWIVVKLAVCGSAAFALNLFSGLMAAVAATLIGITGAIHLRRDNNAVAQTIDGQNLKALFWGAVIGGLTLAFAYTYWKYAIRFTPYMFTAFFTALILWAMIKWWYTAERKTSFYWLFVVTLLFGLDFSVHRTNQLLAPGLIIWMLIRSPRAFLAWRTWAYGAAGLIFGLAFHLLVIPLASAKPFFNASDPSNLSRFWDYVRLTQLGGGFLVKFFPRNAAFWDVQVMDYLRAFSVNFFSWRGSVPVIGLLPGILGLIGMVGLWRRYRRFAVGLLILFALSSIGAILYFNIPANFFRSLHRHYLPSFVIFSVWAAYGAGSALLWAARRPRKNRALLGASIIFLLLALPAHQIAKNYRLLDGSKNYFTFDTSMNIFSTLPENAILISGGDNDTFPLWYFQKIEGIRPDVTVLNTSLLNTRWFVKQMMEKDQALPFVLDQTALDNIGVRRWQDTSIEVTVTATPADFALPDDAVLPEVIKLQVSPSVSDTYIMAHEWLLLNLIENNRWRRPIYFMPWAGPEWIEPYMRLEGMASRLIPYPEVPLNTDLLKENLFEKYAYRGYADEDVVIDPVSRQMAITLLAAYLHLGQSAIERGDTEELAQIRAKLHNDFPPERLRPLSPGMEQALEQLLAVSDKSS